METFEMQITKRRTKPVPPEHFKPLIARMKEDLKAIPHGKKKKEVLHELYRTKGRTVSNSYISGAVSLWVFRLDVMDAIHVIAERYRKDAANRLN